jgi:non-specific protein-tyrosine kinase
VPTVAGWKEQERPFVVSIDAPQSPAAEAYRSLRTSLEFGLTPGVTLIHMTSPDAGDGKTTTVSNLAVSLAAVGRRVVMVDCDLRRPRLHHFFGLENTHGLSSVLQGQTSIANVIQPVRGIRDLALIAAGPAVTNPAELLAHRRTAEAMQTLRSTADIILIDGPPVLPVTDARILARMVDAVIVVVTAGNTPRKDTAHAVELLRQINAPLVGTILNSVTAEGRYGYGYGYGYHADAPRKRRFWRSSSGVDAAPQIQPRQKAGRSTASNGGKRSSTGGPAGGRPKARKR